MEGAIPALANNESLRTSLGLLFSWKVAVLAVVVLTSMFVYRPFCKYLCPLGGIYGLFNRFALFQMNVDRDKCIDCKKCEQICPMQVDTDIENGKEVKRFKNIEIPDEIKKLPYQDFEFSIPITGVITFKIMFEEGVFPKVWPEARRRKSRKVSPEEAPMPERITAGLQAALEQAEAEGQPVAEIAKAAAQGAEIIAELNGQELTITAHEPETMEAAFNVTSEHRKALVEAVKAFVDALAVYQNAPSFAYVIGDYTVSKTGMVSGPANEALMAALNAKGFVAE